MDVILDYVVSFFYNLFFDVIPSIVYAYLLADFIMGIYHWAKDSYFSPFTPIIGKTFIWGSRLHHVRPRHVMDFTNREIFTDSAKWTAIWFVPLLYFTGINVFMLALFFTISINDIVHKYAHTFDNERPYWATFLQNIHVFQSHDEHHIHHISPHEIKFCPISPYLNVVLERIDFWGRLEGLIETCTGVKARAVEYDFVEDASYPAGVKFINRPI